ncbi:glycoside hydrolase family 25 protein [Streptomyces sp. NPDC054796]
MTVRGIDVSSYQSTGYSTKDLDFVIVKATEGTSYINPKQVAQAKRAREAGLVVGFYHFLRGSSGMKEQARYFVEKCASLHGDMLFADWEDPSVSCAEKDQFLAEVKRLRGKTHRVGLYCNVDYWTRRDTTSNAGDALWIAQYNGKPGKPSVKHAWRFHQYTDNPIDKNVGDFKDRAALRKWADKDGTAPKPYTPPAFPTGLAPGKAKPSAKPLQRAAKAAGFMAAGVKESDNYGPATQKAVAAFHNAHPEYRAEGKSYDSAIGPKGWAKLHRLAYGR